MAQRQLLGTWEVALDGKAVIMTTDVQVNFPQWLEALAIVINTAQDQVEVPTNLGATVVAIGDQEAALRLCGQGPSKNNENSLAIFGRPVNAYPCAQV